MHNVVPTYVLVRRSRQLLLAAFLVVCVGIFVSAVGLAMFVLALAPKENESFPVVRNGVFLLGVLIGLFGLVMAVRAMTWRTENDLAKQTGEFLSQFFDERYTFIRNVSRIGLGYIDAVLIGPAGILVFRIFDNEGIFFNEKGSWLKQDPQKKDWQPLRFNPTKQAVDDIQHLKQYFERQKLPNLPVFGVIVLTKEPPAAVLTVQEPVVPSAQFSGLMGVLSGNYLAKERLDMPAVTAAVRTLFNP